MRIFQAAAIILLILAPTAHAADPAPDIDLQEGKVNGVFIGAPGKTLAKSFRDGGGRWIGTWLAYPDLGFFLQPARLRNMAGASMSKKSWPGRKYGFADFSGKISFGLNGASDLDAAVAALKKDFTGSFYVTLEEERGVWNRQFIAFQLTGWKTNPPFYFEIFFGKDKALEEIRLKSFPNKDYPLLLRQRATGPDAIEKNLAR